MAIVCVHSFSILAESFSRKSMFSCLFDEFYAACDKKHESIQCSEPSHKVPAREHCRHALLEMSAIIPCIFLGCSTHVRLFVCYRLGYECGLLVVFERLCPWLRLIQRTKYFAQSCVYFVCEVKQMFQMPFTRHRWKTHFPCASSLHCPWIPNQNFIKAKYDMNSETLLCPPFNCRIL